MSLSASFLYRFIDDVWDLLPTEDRELFETYWRGLVRAGGNLQQKTMEANASLFIEHVPVFLTERWNKYTMDDATADLFVTTEAVVLAGSAETQLQFEAVLFDTLSVSNATRNIPNTESIQFFDNTVRTLRYGKLVPNTISVRNAEIEFTRKRDFTLNETLGEIQRTPNSRIPTDALVSVSYGHEEYTEGLDYVVDEEDVSVARLGVTTAIPSGATVTAGYTYNATSTIPLSSSDGAVLVDLKTFTDTTNTFGGVSPGRILTITSGPNEGTYTVLRVTGMTSLEIVGSFPAVQSGDVVYTIAAFPYAMRVDKNIASIPLLQDLIDGPSIVWIEGVDYIVRDGILASRKALPLQTLGPEEKRTQSLWAEVTKINAQTPYRNFGVLIDFFRENSEEYKLALQGLWFTFWTGSTHGNLVTGLHILMGLPFARNAGTVVSVSDTQIQIEDGRGQILSYTIPANLVAQVARGDEVVRFQRLVNGVRIIDRINEPGFVAARLGREGISRFLTSNASVGPGDSDETRALTLLENHLFLPQILAEAVTSLINVQEFVTYLDNMKPAWTEYVFSISVSEDETIILSEDEIELSAILNLTTTVSSNEFNQVESFGSNILIGTFGAVLGAGSQAAGNFQDLSRDFTAAGIGKGSVIHILTGDFIGTHAVLERKNDNLLSLDIPDVDLVNDSGLDWRAITEEQARLNHDAPTIRDPNIILDGANYTTPTTLNVQTDADFGSTMLTDEDVKAMLLIDIGISGAEVQAITDADIANGEIQVGTAPGGVPVAQAHQIGSVAVVRTDNGGPGVTDVFAI